MISRRVLWPIIIGVAAVLIMTWRMGRFPAHVVVINQSGTTITHVVLTTEDGPSRNERDDQRTRGTNRH